ncbi:kinase-like domain-containing protein [Cubamyces lactineus]|nr:kinase-like domain-containing protein [Cubamyces lactineus]
MPADVTESPSVATTSTQQPTQSTQEASQTDQVADAELWGQLIPCSAILPRYRLYKSQPVYRIGRDPSKNDIVISNVRISREQCTLQWDGDVGPNSGVTVTNKSDNGTYVNGKKIPGKDVAWILRDGNELGLGISQPRLAEGGIHDYRYIYRHMAYTVPSEGVHKFYDMQHSLGKGSYATVMKALHKEEGKWYAIKIISTSKLRGDWAKIAVLDGAPKTEEAKRKLREITILERLQHKNICQLKEVYVQHDNIYLVLELVPGGDLVRHLLQRGRQGRRLTESQAKHITYQICDALAYVHAQGIAHRDLKLENVLLTNDDPPVVKVADFGLAKVIDTLTVLHTVCGTPDYLAPEVVLQGPDGSYSTIVDSWSVGVITFKMLTMQGDVFRNQVDTQDLKVKVTNRRIDWDLLCATKCSEEARDFCRKLLENDPKRRMTLTDARHHPWLASLGKEEAQGSSDASTAEPTAAAAPPRSADEEMPALKRSLASIHVDPPARQRSCSTTSARSDDLYTTTLEPRADVISRAEETGRPLPSPSQEMQRAMVADRTDTSGDEEGDDATKPGTKPGANKRKMADRSGSSLLDSSQSQLQPQEAQEVPGLSLVPPTPTPDAAPPAKEPGKSSKAKGRARPPAPKKARTTRDTLTADAARGEGSDADEVPGLFLLRRSPRLNPS